MEPKKFKTFEERLKFLMEEGHYQKFNTIDGAVIMGQIIQFNEDHITLHNEPRDSEGNMLTGDLKDCIHYISIPIKNILCVTESTVQWM